MTYAPKARVVAIQQNATNYESGTLQVLDRWLTAGTPLPTRERHVTILKVRVAEAGVDGAVAVGGGTGRRRRPSVSTSNVDVGGEERRGRGNEGKNE